MWTRAGGTMRDVRTRPSAWNVVLGFGLVSLAADMVYEGARSVYGPVLVALGAGTFAVGLVTGAGEAMALVLRLVAGPWADRSGNHWSFTILGYGLTAVCVPLLAVTPLLGSAGLAVGILLILTERAGKALRSPSKSALLAHAARAVGRGKGFGIHKALDQIGAVSGPLLVAAVIGAVSLWAGLGVLAVPGVLAMVILLRLRARVPDLTVYDPPADSPAAEAASSASSAATPAAGSAATSGAGPAVAPAGRPARGVRGWISDAAGAGLGRTFFGYALSAALTTGGLVTFALLAVHLTEGLGLPLGTVPVVYAAAMLVEAVLAPLVGQVYDRVGARVLLVVPFLVAVVPVLAFGPRLPVVLAGVLAWAAATAIQDSTIKALVAELVPGPRLATGYGVFAAVQGVFAVLGGALAGWLLGVSVPALVAVVAVAQLLALLLLGRTLRSLR